MTMTLTWGCWGALRGWGKWRRIEPRWLLGCLTADGIGLGDTGPVHHGDDHKHDHDHDIGPTWQEEEKVILITKTSWSFFMILDKLRNWQSDCDKKLLSLDSDEMTFYNHLVSLNGDCDSDENCGWEENVRGDEEGRKEDQVARHLHLDDHHRHHCRWHHLQRHHCHWHHRHHDGHLEGAQWLDHVAEDEEDVGDAEAAEQPVEEGSHWPGDHHKCRYMIYDHIPYKMIMMVIVTCGRDRWCWQHCREVRLLRRPVWELQGSKTWPSWWWNDINDSILRIMRIIMFEIADLKYFETNWHRNQGKLDWNAQLN